MENYIVINGKKVDLTKEQLEKLGIKIEEDIFEPKDSDNYYFINAFGVVQRIHWNEDNRDISTKSVGNCCTDKNIMQQRAWHETLERLLWRFSMRNRMQDLDWEDGNQNKYFIYYSYYDHRFFIDRCFCSKKHATYFVSKDIAQEAIDTIVKPFMKEHPDFVW